MEEYAEISRLSMRDIYNHYKDYGIPNFQRGLVWNSTSEALLLESIYHKTPCGILLFWKPKELEKVFGVPLVEPDFKQFIVDGQQRIHIMYSVFSELADEKKLEATLDGRKEIDGRDLKLWCINYARLSNDENKNAERNLFIKKEGYSYKEKDSSQIIPLNVLYHFSTGEDKYKERIEKIYRLSGGEFEKFSKEILGMTKAKVFIEEYISGDSAKIIDHYTRINTSGKRVEPYERAFATLVKCHPETNRHIQEIFNIVYPGVNRRGHLERRRENLFGFQVFIKIFALLFTYHAQKQYIKSKSLYAVFEKQNNQEIIEKNPTKIAMIWEEVKRVVRYFGGEEEGILRRDLFFDDLRFFPQGFIEKLTPLFLMAGMYHTERNKKEVTYLTLRVLLFGYKKDVEVVDLLIGLARTSVFSEAYNLLNRSIHDIEHEKEFRKNLLNIRSVQNQYINVLYALTRKQKAEDFKEPEHQGKVCKKTEPQKQHIIPRSDLIALYGIKKANAQNHEIINNIGNITYISARQNSFTKGLGNRYFDYDSEPETNLQSHSLFNPKIKKSYNILKNSKKNDNKDYLIGNYKEFLRLRRDIICEKFIEWVKCFTPVETELNGSAIPREEPCLWTQGQDERMKKLLKEVSQKYVKSNPQMNVVNKNRYTQILINDEIHFEISIEKLAEKSEERYIQIHLDLEKSSSREKYDKLLQMQIANLNGQIPFKINRMKRNLSWIWYVVDQKSNNPNEIAETLSTFVNLFKPIWEIN